MEDEAASRTRPQVDGESVDDTSIAGSNAVYEIHSHPGQPSGDRYGNAAAPLSALDMSGVAAALPDYMYRQPQQPSFQHQYGQATHGPAVLYPYQHPPRSATMLGNYPMPYPQHMQPQSFAGQRMYGSYPTINPNMSGGNQPYSGPVFYPQQQPGILNPVQGQYPSMQQTQSFGHAPASMHQMRSPGQYQATQMRIEQYGTANMGNPIYSESTRRTGSAASPQSSSTLRGPPRKPKQSGNALWVGNLPPGTNIIDLKDHFSREATDDIESVFLISKSNCAFVNYKNEQSCTAAMARFHDSRFNGVRLVCRLRRGSGPTTIGASGGTSTGKDSFSKSDLANGVTEDSESAVEDKGEKEPPGGAQTDDLKVKEKFFIIKSLTNEDLERSVNSGLWATQSHNETVLNEAFQKAGDVFLIFSANKSGEYFGYARMESPIDGEAVDLSELSAAETPKSSQVASSPVADHPMTIPTSATATAPRGYIIDDSARGTIFWEAESAVLAVESTPVQASPRPTDSAEGSGDEGLEAAPSSGPSSQNAPFGKPFKITWVSIERLPFYRTRGLRNPWNNNREVKIARDGTELEPTVGRKLVGMFNIGEMAGQPSQQGQHPGFIPTGPGQNLNRPY